MNKYKEAIFDAIMWSQGVENLLRDCVLKCVSNGKLMPSDKTLDKIKNDYGLSNLAEQFKPCMSDDLYKRLIDFSKDRNELAHRAADRYMVNVIAGMDEAENEVEIWRLLENKLFAGDLYGELLELHKKYS